MPLIKAFSHDPLTGERLTKISIVPQLGIVRVALVEFDNSFIEKFLDEELIKKGFPVELGFKYQSGSGLKPALIYSKSQLLTTEAKIKALIDLLESKIIDETTFFNQLSYNDISLLEHSYIKDPGAIEPIVMGNGLYPGAVTGKLVFSLNELLQEPNPIWVQGQVTNEETKYFSKAKAIVLTKSGATSHAAILAKNLMIPTIIGGAELLEKRQLGRVVSVDGNSGKIFDGSLVISKKSNHELISKIKTFCLKRQKIQVLANAETQTDLENALVAGAFGVGLCRTEHMFLSQERLDCIKDILFKADPSPESYEKLLNFQEKDFIELFKLIPRKEIVVRYLDAPLHEFGGHKEENPMLGFRGARMLIAKPELIKIQTRAIFRALSKLSKDAQPKVILEIPLVVSIKEVQIFKHVVLETLKEFPEASEPHFAVMVETPRACLIAGDLAGEVDYLSFGTNDLTQMTFAFSRDDSGSFLELYKNKDIISSDPFVELDEFGVGELMQICIERARKVNSKIQIAVCGEQAGTTNSLKLINRLGVDSVSVGPGKVWATIFRVAQL